MFATLRARGLLWPTLLSLLGLAVLVALGNWQMRRLAWKQAMIEAIESRAKEEPVSMDAALAAWRQDPAGAEYLPVRVAGEFVGDIERNYYVGDAKLGPGAQVYSPLRYAEGAVVWVDRGFRPDSIGAEATARGPVEVIGRLRAAGARGMFSPQNDPGRNIWYWRDLAGLQRSAFEGADAPRAAPFFIEAQRVDGAGVGAWPKPGASPVRIENRHFEYALTWYGLAATLFAVWLAFAISRWRRDPGER